MNESKNSIALDIRSIKEYCSKYVQSLLLLSYQNQDKRQKCTKLNNINQQMSDKIKQSRLQMNKSKNSHAKGICRMKDSSNQIHMDIG